jgi:hypothetical protein
MVTWPASLQGARFRSGIDGGEITHSQPGAGSGPRKARRVLLDRYAVAVQGIFEGNLNGEETRFKSRPCLVTSNLVSEHEAGLVSEVFGLGLQAKSFLAHLEFNAVLGGSSEVHGNAQAAILVVVAYVDSGYDHSFFFDCHADLSFVAEWVMVGS